MMSKLLEKQKFNVKLFLACFFIVNIVISQNNKVSDSLKVNKNTTKLEKIVLSSLRVSDSLPISYTNVHREELAIRNLGQDIPILLNFTPSIVSTSDAGNGVGYSGIRIRGSDATRVNVTLNGIPYNDSESHSVYWVNIPDFVSSTEDIQIQRGVGSSTNGPGAFGGVINLKTQFISKKGQGEISNSYGSFDTRKHTIKFSTGTKNNIELAGTLSKIYSNGYIDRASSDLESYFLQSSYVTDNRILKAIVFGGREITYQSWYGVGSAMLKINRTFNYAGSYTDINNQETFYDNQVDNYKQDHLQLHWTEKLSDSLNFNLAFHYTNGRGYYEEYQVDEELMDYGLENITINTGEQTTSDMVVQKWLKNHFYGIVFSLNIDKKKYSLSFGGAYNIYEGKHFGELIWARYTSNSSLNQKFYDNFGDKKDFNIYTKYVYKRNALNLFADLQFRQANYTANSYKFLDLDESYSFFNPKIGAVYTYSEELNFYTSLAIANREPNRTDFENGTPKPEKLNDIELGFRYKSKKLVVQSNFYYMIYENQLVLTGEIDDVGSFIRKNVGSSYRFGHELSTKILLNDFFLVSTNITLSINKNNNFKSVVNNEIVNHKNTYLPFSPPIVINNIVSYKNNNFNIGLLSNYVDEQYLRSLNSENVKLGDYFVNNLQISYELESKRLFSKVIFSGLLNNFLDVKYSSNGYYSDGYVAYFPQAGVSFLTGVTLKF